MPGITPPDPEAQPLLRVIVEAIDCGRIHEGDPRTFLAYSEALNLMGISPRGRAGQQLQRHGLNELNFWTMKHEELPKVAALVVNKKSHRPSSGFAESHGRGADKAVWVEWWMQEANRAINYDWKPFLGPILRHLHKGPRPAELRVREDDESEAPAYRDIIVVDPPPARIRTSRITVGDVLSWLATGQTETEILREHRELQGSDIRASLAYAAERERKAWETDTGESRLSAIASRWKGKITLPKSDPSDPRREYLLRKYWRNRG